jgi:hypothetical protein
MESFNSDLRRIKKCEFKEMVYKKEEERKINFIQNAQTLEYF